MVSAAKHHTCGITTVGIVQCWGDPLHASIPDSVNMGGPYASVSTGLTMSCAIRSNKTFVCWGPGAESTLSTLAASGLPGIDATDPALWAVDRLPRVLGRSASVSSPLTHKRASVLDRWVPLTSQSISEDRLVTSTLLLVGQQARCAS